VRTPRERSADRSPHVVQRLAVSSGEYQPLEWPATSNAAHAIPDVPDLYAPLVNHERVTRVVALQFGAGEADIPITALTARSLGFSRAMGQSEQLTTPQV
jgi:hypothetical protein